MLYQCSGSFTFRQNNLSEFPSDALASIDDATTLTVSPHSAALQTENSFCVIWLKVNDTLVC